MDPELEQLLTNESVAKLFKNKNCFKTLVSELEKTFPIEKDRSDENIESSLMKMLDYIKTNQSLFRDNCTYLLFKNDLASYLPSNQVNSTIDSRLISETDTQSLEKRNDSSNYLINFFNQRSVEAFQTEDYVTPGIYFSVQSDKIFEINVIKLTDESLIASNVILHYLDKNKKIGNSSPMGYSEFKKGNSYYKGALFVGIPLDNLAVNKSHLREYS